MHVESLTLFSLSRGFFWVWGYVSGVDARCRFWAMVEDSYPWSMSTGDKREKESYLIYTD
jgi:hypothetical protein